MINPRLPFFLVLLPFFIVIHIERDLPGLIEYRFVYDHLFFLFLTPFVFLLIFYLLSRKPGKAAMQTFVVLLLFYFFGEIKNAIGIQTPNSFWQSYTFLVPVFFIPALLILYKVGRSNSTFAKHFLYINLGLLLFIAADVFILFNNKSKSGQFTAHIPKDYKPCDSCSKPDIYYIIFDSYTSSLTLKQDFGYSNHGIENSLKEKGFHVLPFSQSNYNMTIFSIGSVFNMDYLPNTDTSRTLFVRDLLPSTRSIYDNRLVSILEKENYKVFNHSIFNMKGYPATTPVYDIWDVRDLYRQYNLIFKAFTEMSYHLPTRLRYFFREEEFHVKARQRDQLDSAIMQQLVSTSAIRSDKPKFVYAHFSKPHSPYTFDSTGKQIVPWPVGSHLHWKESYVEQIVYINKLMEKMVDTILANTQRKTVIIMQGDHGYRFFNEADNAKEFPNFNAVYFPDKDYSMFGDSFTNVNTFRIILNKYLGTKYPLLDDKTYFLRFRIL